MRVRQLHPLISISIDQQVPVVHRRRIKACNQREIAGHHQPLDMMCISVTLCLADRFGHAAHVCLARPVKIRERMMCVQRIGLPVARHLQPVDAADILAPADDLPDEPFHRIQRGASLAPLSLRAVAHIQRVQQAAIYVY